MNTFRGDQSTRMRPIIMVGVGIVILVVVGLTVFFVLKAISPSKITNPNDLPSKSQQPAVDKTLIPNERPATMDGAHVGPLTGEIDSTGSASDPNSVYSVNDK